MRISVTRLAEYGYRVEIDKDRQVIDIYREPTNFNMQNELVATIRQSFPNVDSDTIANHLDRAVASIMGAEIVAICVRG